MLESVISLLSFFKFFILQFLLDLFHGRICNENSENLQETFCNNRILKKHRTIKLPFLVISVDFNFLNLFLLCFWFTIEFLSNFSSGLFYYWIAKKRYFCGPFFSNLPSYLELYILKDFLLLSNEF